MLTYLAPPSLVSLDAITYSTQLLMIGKRLDRFNDFVGLYPLLGLPYVSIDNAIATPFDCHLACMAQERQGLSRITVFLSSQCSTKGDDCIV